VPFEEGTLNDLGYRLLGMGRVDDAIAVLRLNTDAYPKSPNAFNSLGVAYRLKGDKTLAVRAYRHSLELNPENPTAIQALEELGHL
jgi:Flp pilus assembly protein TadD